MNTKAYWKLTFTGLITALGLSFQLYGATVDGTFDDNQNDFGYYWYYYDDNSDVDKNSRSKVAVPGIPSTIDVPSITIARHAFGDTTDNWLIKSYSFHIGAEPNGNRYAQMPFTIGSTWKALYGTATPYVGIGTMLATDGQSINLPGAKSISFKLRSHVYPLTVNFKVQTKEIDDYSMVPNPPFDASGYYARAVNATKGAWTTVTVKLNSDDLAQPTSWCKEFPWDFNSNVTRLVWDVLSSINPALKEGTKDTLDIDDITIDGYLFPYTCPPYAWCAPEPEIPKNGLFSDFEKEPTNQGALGYYWYAYNDADISGKSHVDAGADSIPGSTHLQLNITAGAGSGGSNAPEIKFTLGPAINQENTMVNGFVGVGVNTYDSINCKYWNAQEMGVKSIFFQYTYQGDASYLTLEVRDSNDIGDSKHPTRKDKRGQNVIWFKNLLPTLEGAWRSVEIPFNQLSIDSELAGANPIPLDLKALTKFTWKVQGTNGQKGRFAIDNIYFPGVGGACACPTGIINTKISVNNSSFHAFYRNGGVNVNWSYPTALSSGQASLINARGSIISITPIGKRANFSKSLLSKNIPSGIYFVRLNAVDTNGKAVVMQTSVNVIK